MNLRAVAGVVVVSVLALGCEAASPRAPALDAQQALSIEDFAAIVDRVSEAGGYFDTDNLISNESGYLNVLDALGRPPLRGGAYVGVGPDQNYSYIAELRPQVAFITDVRRDNVLHHLLLKALVERAPTRIEYLAGLHGVEPPADPNSWIGRDLEEIVAWLDAAHTARGADRAVTTALQAEVRERVQAFGVPLSESDFETIGRFHRSFVAAGMSLRFTSFGRPPRAYYPTYRQLTLETDVDGDQASYLASPERYAVVRELHLANRIIPVVGDMAGAGALREMGEVLREFDVELKAFYASNVEFYLWQSRTFESWLDNLRTLPRADDAVLIRSYFGNFGSGHPSAVAGYYATQSLQPIASLVAGGFTSYWDVVTRDVLPLR